MMTLIFLILFFGIFGKIAVFAIKAAWGLTKVVFTLLFLPLIIIGFALSGLIYLAFIGLIIAGVVMLVKTVVV
ncbi:MAG: hypothetical protein MJZ11_08780 [Lachnospiraceae bacterium]|nr:hypothetical protein [Lachnospiraceae bacterium]